MAAEQRLASLRRLRVLETPREERFERITQLARALFDVPVAAIGLKAADSAWLSTVDPTAEAGAPTLPFCAETLALGDTFVVPDARADVRFRDDALVDGEPGIRFYAGHPVTARDGATAGTFYILDLFPRTFDERDASLLRMLAAMVDTELEMVRVDDLEAVLESERTFRLLAETSAEAMFLLDRRGEIRFVNAAAERMFGYPRRILLGQSFEILLPERRRARLRRAFNRHVATGRRAIVLSRVLLDARHRRGDAIPTECSLCEFRAEQERLFAGVVRDLSERRRAEARLRRRDAILEAVSFAAERFLRTVSLDEDCDRLLQQLGTATGASRVYIDEVAADADGTRRLERRHEWLAPSVTHTAATRNDRGDDAQAIDRWLELLAAGEAVHGPIQGFAGSERDFLAARGIRSVAIVPVRVGNTWWGTVGLDECDAERVWSPAELGALRTAAGILGAAIERGRVEKALRIAKDEAEAANISKSQFLANMSHELRTPLNSVIGFTNILLKNKSGNLPAQDCSYLERILANGRHLLSLINDVLDLAKVEAGKMQLELEPVALDQLVTDVLGQLEGRALGQDLVLTSELPPLLGPITTDPARLRQVIINLVGNALKFTSQGGVTICVTADPATHRPLSVAVRDTGIGIPADRLAGIFSAFEQAEAGTSRHYGGTGLGLTISRTLCDLMGFTLTAESEVGRGSTFIIDFRTT